MGTYTFDIFGSMQLGDAVKHARAQLMNEISKHGGYNFLVLEGCVPCSIVFAPIPTTNMHPVRSWSLTVMQKSNARRIEVRYHAHPAVVLGRHQPRTPPFLALLGNS